MTTLSIPKIAAAPRVNVSRLATFAPILSILALQTIVSLSLRNTAFQDEGTYLYAGRQLLHQLLGGPPAPENYARYFSGVPYFYPVIAGAIDQYLGGLEAARMMSLICMLWATTVAFAFGHRLYGREAGLLGAALYAVQGSVLFLSRLATFDAFCLGLLALAAWLALRASAARQPWLAPLVGVVLLLVMAAKYVGILYVPTVLAILAWQTFQQYGWRQAILRGGLAVAVLLSPVAIALMLAPGDMIRGLAVTTTNRMVLAPAPRLELARRAVEQGGLLFGLALIGLFVSQRGSWPLGAVLVGTALLAPGYHIYTHELMSMHKHIGYGLLFAAPLGGYGVAWIGGYGAAGSIGRRWMASLAICLLVFGIGFKQAQGFFSEWPDVTPLLRVIRTQVRPDVTRILAEECEVPRYYLQDLVAFWQWDQLYWFSYKDPSSGQELRGVDGYRKAIADGYFDIVVLRYGYMPEMAHAIDSGLKDGKHYELIAKIPYGTVFGAGYYWVWRKRA